MPFESIKNWQYFRALKKLPGLSNKRTRDSIRLNPAKDYLLFFNGTHSEDVNFFKNLHREFEKKGAKLKILAFVQTKVDVQEFGMALYNETTIGWNHLPKVKLIELVQSRSFDILFNINPKEFKHLHYLAVASTADFKVSTHSELPNDFDLTVKTKANLKQEDIFRQMQKCLETLSV